MPPSKPSRVAASAAAARRAAAEQDGSAAAAALLSAVDADLAERSEPAPAERSDGGFTFVSAEAPAPAPASATPEPPADSGEAPSRLTIAELMGLKVLFQCGISGTADVTVEAPLMRLIADSKILADTIAACGDSITAAGMPVQVPGVPGAAVRKVVEVLLKGTLCKLWIAVDKYKPKWNVSKKKTGDNGDPTYHRSPSGFEWVDRYTYKFLHMFEFDALRGVVDEFCAKFPTLETIIARDAVSPMDASWASERELAMLAELVFYDNPAIKASKTRESVEKYLRELSPALLARALGHLGFATKFRYFYNSCYWDAPIERKYADTSNRIRLYIQKDWSKHMLANGPLQCNEERGTSISLRLEESELEYEPDDYGY